MIIDLERVVIFFHSIPLIPVTAADAKVLREKAFTPHSTWNGRSP